MNNIKENAINCAVYEKGKKYLGIAKVTIPDSEKPVFDVTTGIGGMGIIVLGGIGLWNERN